MRFALVVTGLAAAIGTGLIAAQASASSPRPLPSLVRCTATLDDVSPGPRIGSRESAGEMALAGGQTDSIAYKGFKVEAHLRQLCDSGGRCSNAYTLELRAKAGEASASTEAYVSADREFKRLALGIGQVEFVTLCEINPN